jgi:hypothetical protein
LERGFVLGIATGRGKSAKEVFQKQIQREHWGKIIIAYYNGSSIGLLSDSDTPDSQSKPHESLKLIANEIKQSPLLSKLAKPELRPFQLTIEIDDPLRWRYIRGLILQTLFKINDPDVQMLESSHSCDIVVKSKASKLNILPLCVEIAKKNNCPSEFVCIGDRGRWPGNDFELLSNPYSLSVDEVSSDISSCWNLASVGKKNVEATLDYLSKIKWSDPDHSFNFEL